MKSIPRFFVPPSAIDKQLGTIVYENSNLCNQLSRVYRARSGDELNFLDGLGTLYKCHLEHCSKDEMKASIAQEVKLADITSVSVTLALPILKGDRFEWALEKMTEIGASKIMPIILERSVVKPDTSFSHSSKATTANRFTRWHSILREASEQCERPTIPQLVMPTSFQSMLNEAAADKDALKIICAERRDSPHLGQLLSEHFKHQNQPLDRTTLCNRAHDKPRVIITVGAEGGFTENEITQSTELGFIPVSLGPLILRAETAAIYALVIAKSCMDMKSKPMGRAINI